MEKEPFKKLLRLFSIGNIRKSLFQCFKRIIPIFLLLIGSVTVNAYNSEEHTLIVDTGFDRLKQARPEIVDYLPESSMRVMDDHGHLYRFHFVKAKKLATGTVDTQIEIPPEDNESLSPASALLSRDQEEDVLPFLDLNVIQDVGSGGRAQDKCLWLGYLQPTYNRNISIPEKVPDSILYLSAFLSEKLDLFTVGQLSALYGDLRRTTYCKKGKCFLTHENIRAIQFPKSNLTSDKWCPRPVDAAEYLRAMASGLVPPMGRIGNTLANSSHSINYHEAGWWGDELLRLANVNDWHFSNVAIAWYVGLHRLALVNMAKAVDDPAYMIKALHLEANALHTFVDLFAFGHMVTHRDKTSSIIIRWNKLTNHPVYRWSEFIIRLGGGDRGKSGRVALDADAIPDLIEAKDSGDKMTLMPELSRNDLMRSYRGPKASHRSYSEERYHTELNNAGAVVRNLQGDRFQMYGDGKLNKTPEVLRVASGGVKASFNSLFSFYEKVKNNELSLESIDDVSLFPEFFSALTALPVYVERDGNGYFAGRWTYYAQFVDRLLGRGLVPEKWAQCRIAYLSGGDLLWPKKTKRNCMLFPEDKLIPIQTPIPRPIPATAPAA